MHAMTDSNKTGVNTKEFAIDIGGCSWNGLENIASRIDGVEVVGLRLYADSEDAATRFVETCQSRIVMLKWAGDNDAAKDVKDLRDELRERMND